MSVREVAPRLTFSPSAPALIDISRQCYAELITDESNLTKTILPEYVDYYSTALLWMRIVTLKQKNSQPLTLEENDLLTLVQTTAFVVSEPILLQLRQLGNVVSTTKQHMYPQFPPLPTEVIANHGGYYGELVIPDDDTDVDIHNLYEEIPCLGVLSEAVKAAISNAPPGPYQSNVTKTCLVSETSDLEGMSRRILLLIAGLQKLISLPIHLTLSSILNSLLQCRTC